MDNFKSRTSLKQKVLSVVAAAACVASVAGPAYAKQKDFVIPGAKDGYNSPKWVDGAGSSPTRVTTYWCTREYKMRIRKKRLGPTPDATHGSEWIHCKEYDDAVYSDGDTPKGDYHFDINGMDAKTPCPEKQGFCDYRTDAGVTAYW